MIIYKASLRGIEVVKVSEAYTSQKCHQPSVWEGLQGQSETARRVCLYVRVAGA